LVTTTVLLPAVPAGAVKVIWLELTTVIVAVETETPPIVIEGFVPPDE
jgi:hypothetical protein